MKSPRNSSVWLLSLASLSTSISGAPAYAAMPYQNLTYRTSGTTSRLSPASTGFRDGTFKGRTFSAYYGRVRVAAKIRNGQLVNVNILRYPTDYRTSRYINSRALPMLQREVISAQSARVNIVSGATLSSMAFLRSLQTALNRARSGR